MWKKNTKCQLKKRGTKKIGKVEIGIREGMGSNTLPPRWKGNNTIGVKIFTNNFRGFNSKKESVEKTVVEKLRPDMINLS